MFNTKFPFYSFMILLALFSNIIVVFKTSKKYKYDVTEIICLLLYENTGIIGGAKILSYVESYKELNGKFDFITLGLSSYGAVIGALLFILLFSFQFKKNLKELLYIFMPSLPLMYAIGKIGCFLVGCCYGIEYNGIFRVMYNYSLSAPKGVYLFPVQIVETICFIVIFIYMIIKHYKNEFNTITLGKSFIICGINKFMLDYFRMSHKNIFLSTNQIISILFILIGLLIIGMNLKKFLKLDNWSITVLLLLLLFLNIFNWFYEILVIRYLMTLKL